MDDSNPKNLKEAMALELKEVAAAQGPVEAEVVE